MSSPNRYTRSSACTITSPGSGLATQNTAFAWAYGSPGALTDLLAWAQERLLLLAFGTLPAASIARLQALAAMSAMRCVQVLAAKDKASTVEHIRDIQGHLRAICPPPPMNAAWALLRPDSYIAATGKNIDAALVGAVATTLGVQA